jgi:peptidoglycan hydrolase FlgJ
MNPATGVRGTAAPAAAAAPGRDDRAQLRALARQFQGVFMNQMFQAMRQSVPEGGFIEKTAGEDMFTSLLDDKLSSLAAARMRNGLTEALYRQLCRRLGPETAPADEGKQP